jgi:hypothetical protein
MLEVEVRRIGKALYRLESADEDYPIRISSEALLQLMEWILEHQADLEAEAERKESEP